ncbi:acylphosphatase [bacterium]|nr:acylphosphatase [bacterium]
MRKRVFVIGRVKGVGYRAYATDEALRLGLKGWVRNRRDGSVEALIDGDDASVREFVSWCRRGAPAARVTNVTAEDDASGEALGPFEVRPTL